MLIYDCYFVNNLLSSLVGVFKPCTTAMPFFLLYKIYYCEKLYIYFVHDTRLLIRLGQLVPW